MAGSDINKKILNLLNSIFKTVGSPIPGFNVDDVRAKQDGDEFSSLFSFENVDDKGNVQALKDESNEELHDINGNKIEVHVLFKTKNAQQVLDPLFQGMTRIGEDDFADKGALLDVLLGTSDERPDNEHPGDGHGLLGFKFNQTHTSGSDPFYWHTTSYNGQEWSWGDICKRLSFSLECQSPGKDHGAIEGKQLSDCGKLIAEYLTKVGLIKTNNEVHIDIYSLVTPVLMEMQKVLVEYFDTAVKKYAPNGVNYTEEAKTPEQQLRAVFDQEGKMIDQIDINTEEGAAAAEKYEAQGYQVGASKHIDVTLQKITGSTSFNMTAIRANYDPSLVLTDMDEIISQPEFLEALSEEPITYSIDVDDDGFDIEPCEECTECNPCESLCEVFKTGIRAYRNLYILHWMSHGNDMMKLHIMSEEMYGELIQEIDTIGELLVEKQGTVPQLDFPCDYIPVQDYDFQTGLDYIKNLIQMYIDCIDFAYCNQDSDVQSVFDEWLRYWKKQLNYFVKGQEV